MKATSTMTPEQEAAWAKAPGEMAFETALTPKSRKHGSYRWGMGCRCDKCIAAKRKQDHRLARRYLAASHEGKRALRKAKKEAAGARPTAS